MHRINDLLRDVDSLIGGSYWFVLLLLFTGMFFSIYLGFPQVRYFKRAFKILTGKIGAKSNKGDTSHFQSLATALSGTVGTGNIAGVALAIHLGGPASLFWMLVTAFLGMTTKFVEVLLSHKYREFDRYGKVAGGPMFYMKKRLNINLKDKKLIKTGYWLGGIFAFATILSSFGTGSLPQINSISSSLFTTFGIEHKLTGLVLAILLGLVILGGISRIASVTSRLVPAMAVLYLLGILAVLIPNYQEIIPSIVSVFTNVFTGTAATGGFIGAGFIYAFNRGVNRGLFSNEAGQGSAPIAHAAAKADEPVSEGMVAILEPFIDTIVICMLTGITLLSSGVWKEKFQNEFQSADTNIINGSYSDKNTTGQQKVYEYLNNSSESSGLSYNGTLKIENGKVKAGKSITVIHARSIAEDIVFYDETGSEYSGEIKVVNGKIPQQDKSIFIKGKSLIHSAPLTTMAFTRGWLGDYGRLIVSMGLLLFAFSTAISWSYYGDRAVTYLFGAKFVLYYRIIYIVAFFFASFIDTTIVWTLSGITVALMTIPNLIGILLLSPEVKRTIRDYWKR